MYQSCQNAALLCEKSVCQRTEARRVDLLKKLCVSIPDNLLHPLDLIPGQERVFVCVAWKESEGTSPLCVIDLLPVFSRPPGLPSCFFWRPVVPRKRRVVRRLPDGRILPPPISKYFAGR